MVGESLVVGNESSYKAWVDLAVEEGPDLFSGLVFFSIKSPNVFFFWCLNCSPTALALIV